MAAGRGLGDSPELGSRQPKQALTCAREARRWEGAAECCKDNMSKSPQSHRPKGQVADSQVGILINICSLPSLLGHPREAGEDPEMQPKYTWRFFFSKPHARCSRSSSTQQCVGSETYI